MSQENEFPGNCRNPGHDLLGQMKLQLIGVLFRGVSDEVFYRGREARRLDIVSRLDYLDQLVDEMSDRYLPAMPPVLGVKFPEA